MPAVTNKTTTLINILKVDPSSQDKLVDMINDSIDSVIHQLPGWVSTNLVASTDGTAVIIISRWRSADHIQAMRLDPRMVAYFEEIRAIASFESILGTNVRAEEARIEA